jgi:hypothetical protein
MLWTRSGLTSKWGVVRLIYIKMGFVIQSSKILSNDIKKGGDLLGGYRDAG